MAETARRDQKLVMVMAPRHPERFGAVAALLISRGWTGCGGPSWKSEDDVAPPGQVVLLDTIGELASVYSLAAVAFVGGSLVAAGGHNPLEPAQFGVPIVMGPHYANFRAITEDLRKHDALRITEKEDLTKTLMELLSDGEAARAMGERARKVFGEQSGATGRSVEALRALLADVAATL